MDFIVYVLLGCLYHLGSGMHKLHNEENEEKLRAAWDRLDRQVLAYVVNLMRANAYVDHTHEISSPYAGIIVDAGQAPVSLEDMIAEGESDELEFKSTLRWDLKERIVNKKLEEVTMKTLAAFATLTEERC
jgi:hypothetical protein